MNWNKKPIIVQNVALTTKATLSYQIKGKVTVEENLVMKSSIMLTVRQQQLPVIINLNVLAKYNLK